MRSTMLSPMPSFRLCHEPARNRLNQSWFGPGFFTLVMQISQMQREVPLLFAHWQYRIER